MDSRETRKGPRRGEIGALRAAVHRANVIGKRKWACRPWRGLSRDGNEARRWRKRGRVSQNLVEENSIGKPAIHAKFEK